MSFFFHSQIFFLSRFSTKLLTEGSVVRETGSVVRETGSVVRETGSVVRETGSVVRETCPSNVLPRYAGFALGMFSSDHTPHSLQKESNKSSPCASLLALFLRVTLGVVPFFSLCFIHGDYNKFLIKLKI